MNTIPFSKLFGALRPPMQHEDKILQLMEAEVEGGIDRGYPLIGWPPGARGIDKKPTIKTAPEALAMLRKGGIVEVPQTIRYTYHFPSEKSDKPEGLYREVWEGEYGLVDFTA